MIAGFLAGWLLLPEASIGVQGLPDISKLTSMSLGALLGTLLFDARRLLRFRPRALDLPALVLVLGPLPTSYSNGLGFYEGFSGAFANLCSWGIPWLMGRLYCSSPDARRELILALVVGGLAYVPICLFEMRMSPQLNEWVYGFYPFKFHTTRRFGGYRPVGFLSHGIELGMLMMSASLAALCLWAADPRQRVLGMPISWACSILLAMTGLSRAIGAWLLLLAGTAAAVFTRTIGSSLLILALLAIPVCYVGARLSHALPEEGIVAAVAAIDAERAASLGFRLDNDRRLMGKALERPVFGWGGWGRQRVFDESGRDTSVTDGLWIILLGKYGFVGLSSWLFVMLGAPFLALRRVAAPSLPRAALAPLLVMLILLPLHTINWLVNGFVNPISGMMAGSIVEAVRRRPPLRSGRSAPDRQRASVGTSSWSSSRR